MEQFYLITLVIDKDKYFSAYGPPTQFNMYQPAQAIKAFSHVGDRVVKIIPEGGAERKHFKGLITGLTVV